MDVVPEHRREKGVTELLHQLLRGDFANRGNTLQRLEHGRGLVTGGQAPGTDQRPQRCGAMAALAAALFGFEFDRVDGLAVEVGDDVAAVRARRHVAVGRAPPGEDGLPVEPHPHPHAAQDEELLTLRRYTQLLAQLQQLDQRVRAVEHPDLGAGHRLLDFPPPLVDQMRRRKNQGSAVAFGVEHGGGGNTHRRLAASHLAIDDRGAFTAIDQQLGDGMDHIGLRLEQLALEGCEDELPMYPHLAGVDRGIGTVERVEQLVAELRHEVGQADGERRRCGFEQVALHGRGIGNSRGNSFEIK